MCGSREVSSHRWTWIGSWTCIEEVTASFRSQTRLRVCVCANGVIRLGNVLMLSEGEAGVDNVFSLHDGI